MNLDAIKQQFDKHVMHNYTRFPICAVRGEGSWLWDTEGKKYLDLFPGWGVGGLGHCHPAVADALAKQARKLIHVANHYYCEEQGEFGQLLSERCGGMQVFFCNSGAEAAEGALKLARLHNQPRYKIITFEGSFHGRTFGAITATAQPAYQKGFTPVVPGFAYAKLNDLESVKKLIDADTCAIMVEQVQGEGGVIPCTKEFLQGLRALADQHNLTLIFDEVQTAPARLGEWFGWQYTGVMPDIVTTAKAIAGGVPMGAFLAKPEVAADLKPGTHASTFGGHSLGCAAGIAGVHVIENEKLMDNIKTLGPWLEAELGALRDAGTGVTAVRRAGFMIGIDLAYPGAGLVEDCRNNGLLINCTHATVLRMLPAYNITKAELAQGLAILKDALARAANKA